MDNKIMTISLVDFLKKELRNCCNLTSRSRASLDTIEDCMEMLGILKNNKSLRKKLKNVQNLTDNIQQRIEFIQ